MKNIQIGLNCTPSKITHHGKIKGLELLITYGGGVGGSKNLLYAQSWQELDNGFIQITQLNGEMMKVNRLNIVTQKRINIVRVTHDLTEYANHTSKKVDSSHHIAYYVLPFARSYEIVNEYFGYSKQPTVAYSYDDITDLGCSEEDEIIECESCGDNIGDVIETLKDIGMCSNCV
jgi:hypothetical protein